MRASRPAAAAYAESALAALPAEGIASRFTPSSRHIEIAQESPRALNDPVGFSPSSLTRRLPAPMRAPVRFAGNSGVIPSPSETIDFWSRTGRAGAYRHMEFTAEVSDSRGHSFL